MEKLFNCNAPAGFPTRIVPRIKESILRGLREPWATSPLDRRATSMRGFDFDWNLV
jgi:hypothetical protein